jgi:shikimate kinase
MLVLVGLMGAGKSSVGKRLSEYLNVGFIDADQEIEKAAGMNIVEIFEKFGEKYFREGERKVINRLILLKPQVLSTGGGAFISKEIREVIKLHGFSIWLKADLETLWPRVSGKGNRPLLNKKYPKKELENLIIKRNPFYKKADITVETYTGINHLVMVDNIINKLKKHNIITETTQQNN